MGLRKAMGLISRIDILPAEVNGRLVLKDAEGFTGS
jgi:hypothetical protein